MPRYRRCSVVACKNRRIATEEKVFTFPYVKEIAEEWVRFSNNPDLRIEEAHLYAKRGRVMCHRHFTSAQFTTPKRLRLNRGAVPTILNSSDEAYEAPEQGVAPTYDDDFNEKDASAADNRDIDSCGSHAAAEALLRIKNDKVASSATDSESLKEEDGPERDETEDSSSQEEADCVVMPLKVELHESEESAQSANVSPT